MQTQARSEARYAMKVWVRDLRMIEASKPEPPSTSALPSTGHVFEIYTFFFRCFSCLGPAPNNTPAGPVWSGLLLGTPT